MMNICTRHYQTLFCAAVLAGTVCFDAPAMSYAMKPVNRVTSTVLLVPQTAKFGLFARLFHAATKNAFTASIANHPYISVLVGAAILCAATSLSSTVRRKVWNPLWEKIRDVTYRWTTPLDQQLIDFTEQGNAGAVKAILAQLGDNVNVNVENINGLTPLMLAAQKGNIAIVNALLAHKKIEVNKIARSGSTTLMMAAHEGKTDIVKALLAHPGIGVNMQNNYGKTALMMATQNGYLEVVKALLAHKGTRIPYAQRSDGGLMDTVRRFGVHSKEVSIIASVQSIPSEVNVNMQDKYGETALMMATQNGYLEVVKALLAQPDLDGNMRNKDYGWTALMIAVEYGHLDIAKALLTHPHIDVNIKDKNNHTALMIAQEKTSWVANQYRDKYEQIVQELREHGAKES